MHFTISLCTSSNRKWESFKKKKERRDSWSYFEDLQNYPNSFFLCPLMTSQFSCSSRENIYKFFHHFQNPENLLWTLWQRSAAHRASEFYFLFRRYTSFSESQKKTTESIIFLNGRKNISFFCSFSNVFLKRLEKDSGIFFWLFSHDNLNDSNHDNKSI